ncbi:MAG: Nitroreductase family protein [Ignavibacteriae bacterium]|nr:MAG: Nitroreductase family protein [Ignavibacteriota bacterium]
MNPIFERRSIRRYTEKIVDDNQIKQLLKAGMCAPSARNARPWHFIVVKDKENLKMLSQTHQYAYMIKDASVAIVVCGDLRVQSYRDYWVLDCSAATENILLEAVQLGLGAVWVAVYPRDERIRYVRNVLSIPTDVIPLCIIPVGYPAETPEQKERYDDSKIHYEKW